MKQVETPIIKKEGVVVITTRDPQTLLTNVILTATMTMFMRVNGITVSLSSSVLLFFIFVSLMSYYFPEIEYCFRKMLGR